MFINVLCGKITKIYRITKLFAEKFWWFQKNVYLCTRLTAMMAG